MADIRRGKFLQNADAGQIGHLWMGTTVSDSYASVLNPNGATHPRDFLGRLHSYAQPPACDLAASCVLGMRRDLFPRGPETPAASDRFLQGQHTRKTCPFHLRQ
jgi:hypothetical protein